MNELYLDNLRQRNQTDQEAVNEAVHDLHDMVIRSKKHTVTPARMERRLPNRALTIGDLVRFAFKSLSVSDIIYILLICVVITLIGMLSPLLNKQIFDNIIPSGEIGNLLPITIVLVAAGIGSLMFEVTRSLLLLRVRDKINIDVQAAVLDRAFTLPTSFFKQYSAGEAGTRVMMVSNISSSLSNAVLSGLLGMIFSVVYFYQVFIYAKSMIGICLLLMGANLLLSVFGYIYMARFQRDIQPATVAVDGFLFSLFNGMQKIKTSGAEQRAFARWAQMFRNASPDKADRPRLLSIMPALSILVSLGGTLLIYNSAFKSQLSLSDYIAFNIAFGMVTGAIASLLGILPTLSSIKPMIELIKPILQTAPEEEENSTPVESLTGAIEVNNLRFRYNDSGPYLYDGLSLKIRPGEYVGIVGKSGCGKSTLVRLMLGLEVPQSGTIFYDQHNLAKVSKQSLRRHIGVCMQDKNLFGGSILDNITITSPLSTIDDAWEVAEIAGIADDIRAMPMGMHTLITENGGGLSGGQKQRILIARALASKPRILFLDEATSALDNICQQKVIQNLDKMRCTRVCIAHRLSTVINCDRILVLDGGKVVEEGNFKTLMEKKGIFYELSKRQSL